MDYTTVSPKGDAFPLSVDCGELVHSFRRRFLSACAAWVVSLNRWVKQFVIFMRLVMTSTVTVCNTVSPTQLTNPSGCKQKPQSKKGCPCHRQAVSKIAPEKSLCASCCAVQKCKKTRENRRGLQLRSIYFKCQFKISLMQPMCPDAFDISGTVDHNISQGGTKQHSEEQK